MSYTSGLLKDRVDIYNRKEQTIGAYGIDTNGIEWTMVATVWANVEWQKGKTGMREGSLDSYGIVIVRMRYNCDVNMRSRIGYNDQMYQILPETFHPDKQANTIQFLAQVIINENQ